MEIPHSWRSPPPTDSAIAEVLLNWFATAGRSFPWRDGIHVYHLLCVEIMLQRTRADQVKPVFVEFVDRYEVPREFVDAGPEAAESIFERLGLRWRAKQFRDLHLVLIQLDRIPEDRAELKSLPGVGNYVADAVRLFGFGQPTTLLDSNVLRILARYYGIEFPDHARRSRRVLEWAAGHAPDDPEEAKRFNWSLIDLGALVCTPRKPACDRCPLEVGCWYAEEST